MGSPMPPRLGRKRREKRTGHVVDSASSVMQVRRLALTDAPDIAALWHAGAAESARADPAFSPSVSPEVYCATVAADLAAGNYIGWGMFSQDPERLWGYLTARVMLASTEFNQSSFLYILDLDVHHEARRQGLGTKLVAAARAFAQSEHLRSVEVSWLSADAAAAAFWQRQGFTQYLARARCHVAPSRE
jgi:ribosomal protein S18 acetylase RimI-like enzyme